MNSDVTLLLLLLLMSHKRFVDTRNLHDLTAAERERSDERTDVMTH